MHKTCHHSTWLRLRVSRAADCDRAFCDQNKVLLCHVYWKYKSFLNSYSDGSDVNYFFNLWESFLSTWKPNHPESWRSIGGAETVGWISFNYLSNLERAPTSYIKGLWFGYLMNWLEKCDPRHSLDVTGWDQLYQALPQHEKHLNNLSNVKLLILKVCGLDI